MVFVNTNILNFPQVEVLHTILGEYPSDFEYTADGIFRRTVPPSCPECGTRMNRNGYNSYNKIGLGSVKIGRYICPFCEETSEEERSFWEKLKGEFFDVLGVIYQLMRLHHVSYQGISSIMELIYPRGKDTIFNAFNDSVEKTDIPPIEDIQIVLYDEQHQKEGRAQKFRLTLLDGVTGQPIAEELYDTKDPGTIEAFLAKYLDPTKRTFVVTDLYPSYPGVFEEFFGENLIHQFCLLHLNKLIVGDFPKNTTIGQELMKYRLLNIFYNRDAEIEVLEGMAEEEQVMKQGNEKAYRTWLKKQKAIFREFLHERELSRRREKKNLEQRDYIEALEVFKGLMEEINSFEKPVQKRLRMIAKNWGHFTAFYFVEGAPATNNWLENYYSTSLKTHRKKQLRTDKGIENLMKLSAMKRAGILGRCKKTLLDAFLMFIPFLKPG
ncbi:ISNCY family transposase ISMac19 [subsurface metagenome]